MKEKKIDQNVKLYYNGKGERIEPSEDLIKSQGPCDNVVDYCCSVTVPDGFELNLNPDNTRQCIDTSLLACTFDPEESTCEVFNPCGGTLTCPVEIQAVRLFGPLRMVNNIGDLTPIGGPTAAICFLCCDLTINLNQIIGFTCDQMLPCTPCFEIPAFTTEFSISFDECNREVVTIFGEVMVNFIGCNS